MTSSFSFRPSLLSGLILSLLCTFTACHNESNSSQEETETTNTETSDQDPALSQTKDFLYAWVDQLNIRSNPNTSAEKVASVQSDEALEFTGDRSDNSETIVLRGVAYNEPWLKVITKDGQEGWVFGGAVKRKDETKGNEIIDDNGFDFPHFGRFNLRTWNKESTKDESGGDAQNTTTTYRKGDQVLEITIGDVGDYGYSRTYKLMDVDRKILKERRLSFSADVGFRELEEVVKDYMANPPKQYTRSQKFEKHHSQLNDLPMMVNGDWTETPIQ